MKLIMENWKKFLAEDTSGRTDEGFLDRFRSQTEEPSAVPAGPSEDVRVKEILDIYNARIDGENVTFWDLLEAHRDLPAKEARELHNAFIDYYERTFRGGYQRALDLMYSKIKEAFEVPPRAITPRFGNWLRSPETTPGTDPGWGKRMVEEDDQ